MSSRNPANSSNNINRISVSKQSSICSYTDRDTVNDAFVGIPDDFSRDTALPEAKEIITSGIILHFDCSLPNNLVDGDYAFNSSGKVWQNFGTDSSLNFLLFNGITTSDDGRGSLVFDGVDDWCELSTSGSSTSSYPWWPTTSGTISHWVKDAAPEKLGVLFYGSNGSSVALDGFGISSAHLEIHTGFRYGQPRFYYYRRAPLNKIVSDIRSDIGSEWTDLTVTWSESGVMSLYRNGELQNTTYMADTSWDPSYLPDNIYLGATEYRVQQNISKDREWTGKVANVMMYDRELSAQEVKHNYEAMRYRFQQNERY